MRHCYVFIDTNVFLSFYHLTSEDLQELEKLKTAIDGGVITLLLPHQVIDETRRNRSNKIKNSLDLFRKAKYSEEFPAYCKQYPEYEKISEHLDLAQKLRAQLLEKLEADIIGNRLAADKLVSDLFQLAETIPLSEEILINARRRIDVGNPPGKKGSLGDAINWECLLASAKTGMDVFFVSGDKDYFSPINEKIFDEFLLQEWNALTNGEIFFYPRLSYFTRDNFPQINLETEAEKDRLIEELQYSATFASTHLIIDQLSKYDDFLPTQVERLVEAMATNNQVHWILADPDVFNFFDSTFNKMPFAKTEHAKVFIPMMEEARERQ